MSFLRHYRWDLVIALVIFTGFLFWMGAIDAFQFVTLAILEISLSFDNAVVNALVLKRLSHGWRRAFVTVGIWVAVFGMRLVFPVVIVWLTTGIAPVDVALLAVNDPATYAHHLELAHPEIAALGGVYLGMIFLNFFLGDENTVPWLKPIERFLAKIGGRADGLSAFIMIVVLLTLYFTIGGEEGVKIVISGSIALGLFLAVQIFGSFFEHEDEEENEENGGSVPLKAGWAGLGLFVYLEVQDAAFSFDGVSGAFAITSSVILIAAGLGVGALFVRSMTVHFVESGKLDDFPYLASGAHWAIGALAVSIIGSLFVDIPEWLIGPLCAAIILAAGVHSWIFSKRTAREALTAVPGPVAQGSEA